MAQRFKATDLKDMIRTLVREEIKEVVKATINEVLSERYLRQLAEVAASRPRGTGRTLHVADGDDQEDEGTPQVLRNDSLGIYNRHPMKHDDRLEDDEPENQGPVIDKTFTTIPEGVDRGDMMSMFFEGTRPINEIDADSGVSFEMNEQGEVSEDSGDEGVPLPNIQPKRHQQVQAKRPLNEVWKELAGIRKPAQGSAPQARPVEVRPGAPIPVDPQVEAERMKMEEARLKRHRESLERKA